MDLRVLQPVGAHGPSLGEALIQQDGGFPHLVLHPARGTPNPLADPLDGNRGQRIQSRGDQGQQPVQIDHRPNQPDHRDRVRDPIHRASQGFPDGPRVRREPRGKLGRGLALQPSEVGMRQMREHPDLQGPDHQQHDLLHLHVLKILRRRLQRCHPEHQDRDQIQDRRILRGKHLERAIDHHRIERRHPRHDPGQHQHQQQTRLVVPHMVAPKANEQGTRVRGFGLRLGGRTDRRDRGIAHGWRI